MTEQEYKKKYDKLWSEAEKLPRPQAIKKLEECAALKKEYQKEKDMKKSGMEKVQAALGLLGKISATTGPRGGKIIGETSSGKPIYDKANHPSHKSFTGKDHHEAYAAHSVLSARAQNKRDYDSAQKHGEQQAAHKKKWQAHEQLGAKIPDFDESHAKVKITPEAMAKHASKTGSMNKIQTALDCIKVAIDFETYKKLHPETDKRPSDPMFKADHDKMREKIKKDIHESGESKKGLKPGDIFHHKDSHGEGHGVVLHNDNHGGFMFHKSDEKGNLKKNEHQTARDVTQHSNMLFGKAKKIGEKPLEKESVTRGGKEYVSHKSGDPGVDEVMAAHDGRHELFKDHAPALHKGKYDSNEQENKHSENYKMEGKFFDHMKGGGKPEDFRMTKKKSSLDNVVESLELLVKFSNHTLKFYSGPGHGWLEVPEALYKESGVKASRYSYYSKNRKMVYLEEDSDAPKFEHAMKAKGTPIHIEHKNVEDESFIRNLGPMPGY